MESLATERPAGKQTPCVAHKVACKLPPSIEDEEHPHHFCERERRMAFGDGYQAALSNVQELAFHAVGWRGIGRAIRRLKQRAELLTEEARPVEDFLRRVMAGDW